MNKLRSVARHAAGWLIALTMAIPIMLTINLAFGLLLNSRMGDGIVLPAFMATAFVSFYGLFALGRSK